MTAQRAGAARAAASASLAAALSAALLAPGAARAQNAQGAQGAPPPAGGPRPPAAAAPPPGGPAAAPRPPASAQTAEPPPPFSIEHDPASDTVTIQAENADLLQLLRVFSLVKRFNLVPSDEVSGRVTMNLYAVPFHQALRLILEQSKLDFTRDGQFYYIHKKNEQVALDRRSERVFEVNYLEEKEVKDAIRPVMSRDGTDTYMAKQRRLVVRDSPERLDAVARVLAEVDRRPKQVLVEVTLIDVKLTDGMTLGVNLTALAGIDFNELGASSDGSDVELGSVGGSQLEEAVGFFKQGGFASPGAGLTIGLIKNNVAAFLSMIETVSEATVLANPKVLTLDGQAASIQVGGQLGYFVTTVNNTAATQSVSFIPTGTQLSITPKVRPDGFVELQLAPQLSAGSINSVGIPEISTTQVTTNVLVRDGYTLAVGGLIQENASVGTSQLPLLGDVPLLGWLFRQRQEQLGRQEVIFLITPHIIDPDSASHDALRRLRTTNEARETFRRSLSFMMRHVRSNFAFEKARENAREGDRDAALRWAGLATRMSPLHLPSRALERDLEEGARLENALDGIERLYERQAPPRGAKAEAPAKDAPAKAGGR
jgi:type IV pilus assembly protein PilQ